MKTEGWTDLGDGGGGCIEGCGGHIGDGGSGFIFPDKDD